MTRFACAIAALLVLSTVAWAQPNAPGDAAGSELSYFDFFVVKGGWVAYIIISLSVVAMALSIEYTLTIRRSTLVPPDTLQQVEEFIQQRRYVEALQLTSRDSSMLGYVLYSGLSEASHGFAAMQRAVEEAIEERSAKLYRKIEYLNIIGAVSPMLGLFGTVVGMILLFAAIHAADTFPRAQVVADKVAIALVATFWGLSVAIPSLSIYAVFRNRIEVLTAECAITADRVLSVFKPGRGATLSPRGAQPAPTPVESHA